MTFIIWFNRDRYKCFKVTYNMFVVLQNYTTYVSNSEKL